MSQAHRPANRRCSLARFVILLDWETEENFPNWRRGIVVGFLYEIVHLGANLVSRRYRWAEQRFAADLLRHLAENLPRLLVRPPE